MLIKLARRQMIFNLLVLCLIGWPTGEAKAEIYKWVDKDGRVHYSDTKPEQQSVESVDIKVNTFKQVKVFDVPATQSTQSKSRSKRVVMYSTEWCGVCKKAKKYFKQHRIAFREYDIDKSEKARARWKKLGGRGVPVILIGRKKMHGFSANSFEAIYRGSSGR